MMKEKCMKKNEEKHEALPDEAAGMENAVTEVESEAPFAEESTGTNAEAEKEVEAERVQGDEALDEDALAQIANLKKHDAAVLLITKTKHIVADTEKQLDACKLLLQEDLKSYEEAKESLKQHALHESESLLEQLGYGKEEHDTRKEDEIVFQPKEEIPPFDVKEVSSGKFSSSLLALVGGALTFTGLVYLATEKVGVTLDVTQIPSYELAAKVFGWYATLFGGKPDLFLGGAFVVIMTLFVMGLIYGIRVSSHANSNLSFAKRQLEEAQEYAKHKSNCKEEMDKVDAHMNEAISLLKTYEVILNEQIGKLKRILHIEGMKEDVTQYHEKSLLEMRDTDALVKAIRNFIATSMSEEGRLSGKSTMFLHSAKSKLQKFLDRHY
jgi:hypothetical protein